MNGFMKKGTAAFKSIACLALAAFVGAFLCADILRVKSSNASALALPGPTQLVPMSEAYSFPVLKGLFIDPADPLHIEFMIDPGSNTKVKQKAAEKLVRYFLASLSIPEDNIWVNLSPYEDDRIVEENLGITDMGKDLLAQDYVLKQLSASLTHPETDSGKDYWSKTYEKLTAAAGTTSLPVNTFNKVWITPKSVEIFEKDGFVYVTDAKLTAMLEEDYLALSNNVADIQQDTDGAMEQDIAKVSAISSDMMKNIVLPKIIDDVNNGKNFATLRQIYHSQVLAMWFKKKFMESFYGDYIGSSKVKGIDTASEEDKQKIFNLYVEAFKRGVYNTIKKEYDPASQKTVKRRYFSGGYKYANPAVTYGTANSALGQVNENMFTMGLDVKGQKGNRVVNIAGSSIVARVVGTALLLAAFAQGAVAQAIDTVAIKTNIIKTETNIGSTAKVIDQLNIQLEKADPAAKGLFQNLVSEKKKELNKLNENLAKDKKDLDAARAKAKSSAKDTDTTNVDELKADYVKIVKDVNAQVLKLGTSAPESIAAESDVLNKLKLKQTNIEKKLKAAGVDLSKIEIPTDISEKEEAKKEAPKTEEKTPEKKETDKKEAKKEPVKEKTVIELAKVSFDLNDPLPLDSAVLVKQISQLDKAISDLNKGLKGGKATKFNNSEGLKIRSLVDEFTFAKTIRQDRIDAYQGKNLVKDTVDVMPDELTKKIFIPKFSKAITGVMYSDDFGTAIKRLDTLISYETEQLNSQSKLTSETKGKDYLTTVDNLVASAWLDESAVQILSLKEKAAHVKALGKLIDLPSQTRDQYIGLVEEISFKMAVDKLKSSKKQKEATQVESLLKNIEKLKASDKANATEINKLNDQVRSLVLSAFGIKAKTWSTHTKDVVDNIERNNSKIDAKAIAYHKEVRNLIKKIWDHKTGKHILTSNEKKATVQALENLHTLTYLKTRAQYARLAADQNYTKVIEDFKENPDIIGGAEKIQADSLLNLIIEFGKFKIHADSGKSWLDTSSVGGIPADSIDIYNYQQEQLENVIIPQLEKDSSEAAQALVNINKVLDSLYLVDTTALTPGELILHNATVSAWEGEKTKYEGVDQDLAKARVRLQEIIDRLKTGTLIELKGGDWYKDEIINLEKQLYSVILKGLGINEEAYVEAIANKISERLNTADRYEFVNASKSLARHTLVSAIESANNLTEERELAKAILKLNEMAKEAPNGTLIISVEDLVTILRSSATVAGANVGADRNHVFKMALDMFRLGLANYQKGQVSIDFHGGISNVEDVQSYLRGNSRFHAFGDINDNFFFNIGTNLGFFSHNNPYTEFNPYNGYLNETGMAVQDFRRTGVHIGLDGAIVGNFLEKKYPTKNWAVTKLAYKLLLDVAGGSSSNDMTGIEEYLRLINSQAVYFEQNVHPDFKLDYQFSTGSVLSKSEIKIAEADTIEYFNQSVKNAIGVTFEKVIKPELALSARVGYVNEKDTETEYKEVTTIGQDEYGRPDTTITVEAGRETEERKAFDLGLRLEGTKLYVQPSGTISKQLKEYSFELGEMPVKGKLNWSGKLSLEQNADGDFEVGMIDLKGDFTKKHQYIGKVGAGIDKDGFRASGDLTVNFSLQRGAQKRQLKRSPDLVAQMKLKRARNRAVRDSFNKSFSERNADNFVAMFTRDKTRQGLKVKELIQKAKDGNLIAVNKDIESYEDFVNSKFKIKDYNGDILDLDLNVAGLAKLEKDHDLVVSPSANGYEVTYTTGSKTTQRLKSLVKQGGAIFFNGQDISILMPDGKDVLIKMSNQNRDKLIKVLEDKSGEDVALLVSTEGGSQLFTTLTAAELAKNKKAFKKVEIVNNHGEKLAYNDVNGNNVPDQGEEKKWSNAVPNGWKTVKMAAAKINDNLYQAILTTKALTILAKKDAPKLTPEQLKAQAAQKKEAEEKQRIEQYKKIELPSNAKQLMTLSNMHTVFEKQIPAKESINPVDSTDSTVYRYYEVDYYNTIVRLHDSKTKLDKEAAAEILYPKFLRPEYKDYKNYEKNDGIKFNGKKVRYKRNNGKDTIKIVEIVIGENQYQYLEVDMTNKRILNTIVSKKGPIKNINFRGWQNYMNGGSKKYQAKRYTGIANSAIEEKSPDYGGIDLNNVSSMITTAPGSSPLTMPKLSMADLDGLTFKVTSFGKKDGKKLFALALAGNPSA